MKEAMATAHRQLIEQVVEAVAPALGHRSEGPELDLRPDRPPGSGYPDADDFVPYIGAADVTNDGENEILVMHQIGVRELILEALGRRDSTSPFEKLGEVHGDIAGGFEVEDVDGDGRVEISTLQEAEPGELVESFYRWNGKEFERAGTGEVYRLDSDETVPPRIEHLRREHPSWAFSRPPQQSR